MLLPNDLVLPRTIALELVNINTDDLELSSERKTETYRYEILIYSTMRGDVADLVEFLFAGMHGGGDLLTFPFDTITSQPIGKVFYDNFKTVYFKPFTVQDKNIYSASIRFDAVVTR